MPELPEVEATARLLDSALQGAQIESATAPGINALKTFDPPLSELVGQRISRVRRRGKHLIVESSGGLALLIHLMSAGRLQLYDRPRRPPRPDLAAARPACAAPTGRSSSCACGSSAQSRPPG